VNWNHASVKELVRLAFSEDHATQDKTTTTLIPSTCRLKAKIISKQKGVIAGLPLAGLFFKKIKPALHWVAVAHDGDRVNVGQTLAWITGSARSVLSAERPALNALQHLSGIATFTAQQVAQVKGSKTKILDTRKTLPGWRLLEKYAVRCGGGHNHRMSLGDAILVKENHLKICRDLGVDWVSELQKVQRHQPAIPMQIEIQGWEDLREVLKVKPERVLLDNLERTQMRRMISIIRKISGGVRTEDLKPLAKLGVERISMGQLTHSAPAFDCSLDIVRVNPR
jgi:nicotinate-nucleotide pyrophosphorylase (carboxylating)